VGFAAAILIGLFVRDEFSYESFVPAHQHVYRVSSFRIVPAEADFVPVVPPDVAAWMKLDFPGVQSATRLASEEGSDCVMAISRRATTLPGQILMSSKSCRSRYLRESTDGFGAAGRDRSARQMARKYFGRDNPIGETIEINRQHSMQVTAVLMDLPSNTHLETRIFASGAPPTRACSARRHAGSGSTNLGIH